MKKLSKKVIAFALAVVMTLTAGAVYHREWLKYRRQAAGFM